MPNGPEDLTDHPDRPIPFGVSAETGRPLPGLSDEALTHLSVVEQRRGDSHLAAQKSLEQADFAVTDVDDANDLSETGWGVVFAENATADTETALPNMSRGDLLVGSFANNQVGYHRPFAGAGCYRTPVPGLYLCGGSTHPGGNITGLCGYNAARVIAADLGKEIWWKPPDAERALAAL